MATESIHVSALIPASPEAVYAAWLSSEEHGKMTGDSAFVEPHVGGSHRAWGEYISGKTLELEPGKRIVQSWRTVEFPDGSSDSQIMVTLAAEGDHTRVAIAHTEIPEGQGASYQSGWQDHYFTPMIAYFSRPATEAKPAKATKPDAKRGAKEASGEEARHTKGGSEARREEGAGEGPQQASRQEGRPVRGHLSCSPAPTHLGRSLRSVPNAAPPDTEVRAERLRERGSGGNLARRGAQCGSAPRLL